MLRSRVWNARLDELPDTPADKLYTRGEHVKDALNAQTVAVVEPIILAAIGRIGLRQEQCHGLDDLVRTSAPLLNARSRSLGAEAVLDWPADRVRARSSHEPQTSASSDMGTEENRLIAATLWPRGA